MAIQKVESLLIGRGDLLNNTKSSFVFSSSYPLATWDANIPYPIEAVVEYNSKYWRAITSGIGYGPNPTPDIDTSNWALLSNSPKDGDIAYIVAGFSSDVNLRQNSVWVSLSNTPISGTINNNSTGNPLNSLNLLPLSVARAATIEYSISNNGAYRIGTMRYNSDGSSVQLSDTDIVDIGGDVGVTFDAAVVGSSIQISYDSVNLNPSPGTINYRILRWS